VGERGYGMLLSANGVGAFLGALTVARVGHWVDRRVLVLGGLWIFSAMLLVLAMVTNYYLALLCLAVAGWGMLLFFSTINTLLQTLASDAMRGRVMGIWALVFGGMTPLGGLEAGILSHYLGLRWAIAVGAIICGIAALIVLFVIRRMTAAERQNTQ
jgi:MFS family permease